MMDDLVTTIEDIQLRAFQPVQLSPSSDQPQLQQQAVSRTRSLAASSRYGICVALGTDQGRRGMLLFSALTADIHKLDMAPGQGEGATPVNIRTIQYHNQQAEPMALSTNCDGTSLSVATLTPNGPFVDIFDILCFDPATERQPFPMASIRLSSSPAAQLLDLEWNPTESDLFAAVTSDNQVSTVRCGAIQGNAGGGNTFAQTGLPGALCLSWSPKGKQLVVGDAQGRVHQLKPELAGQAVRQIEAPRDVPGSEGQPLACTALCWLSTTEWLVAYQPKQSIQPQAPSICLLVVKKQQPPKWAHFGDALPTARTGPPAFCPLLEWHMVFLYSPDSTQVAVFGQRGEAWRKFEFETFDIEMPLARDGRSNTFPVGAALDFSSTRPILLDQGAGRVQLPPAPMLHLLNSAGQLLPYAIVCLPGGEQKPALNKPTEPIHSQNARFGQPPPGWQPPPPPMPQQPQQVPMPTTPTTKTAVLPQSSFQTPPAAPPETRPRHGVQAVQQQQDNAATEMAAAKKLEQEQKEAREEEEQQRRRSQQKAAAKLAEEEEEKQLKGRILALEQAVERAVLDYTRARNAQAQRLGEQLATLRYEIERRSSTTELAHFERLAAIRADLSEGLRGKGRALEGLCAGIRRNAETLGQLRAIREEAGKEKPRGRRTALAHSFDMQKRLELLEGHFDRTLNGFERAKRMLDRLDEELLGRGNGTKLMSADDDSIDPLEQRKLIQTNENIAKMCSRLGARLQQVQRQLETGAAQNRGAAMPKVPAAKGQKPARDVKDVAHFCVLQLEQLDLNEGGTSTGIGQAMVDEPQQRAEFQRSLYNYLAGLEQFRGTGAAGQVRRIQPLQPRSRSGTRQKQAMDEPRTTALAQKMAEAMATPARPQRVSIGVQSPDFMATTVKSTAEVRGTAPKPAVTKPAVIPLPAFPPARPVPTSTPIATSVPPTPPLFSPLLPASATNANAIGPRQPSFSFQPQPPLPAPAKEPSGASTALPIGAEQLPSLPTLASTRPAQTTPALAPFSAQTLASSSSLNIVPTTTTVPAPAVVAMPAEAEKPLTTANAVAPSLKEAGQEKQQPMARLAAAAEVPAQLNATADEGMEDEMASGQAASAVSFDFMKGIGLGSVATSTPVNANKNPFGSIPPAGQLNNTSAGSGGLFSGTGTFGQSASSTFGTPNRNANASQFGSFGTASGTSPAPASAFGASAFGSPAAEGNAFGTKPTFGGARRPLPPAARSPPPLPSGPAHSEGALAALARVEGAPCSAGEWAVPGLARDSRHSPQSPPPSASWPVRQRHPARLAAPPYLAVARQPVGQQASAVLAVARLLAQARPHSTSNKSLRPSQPSGNEAFLGGGNGADSNPSLCHLYSPFFTIVFHLICFF